MGKILHYYLNTVFADLSDMKILDRWPIFLYCLNTIYFSNIDYWATQKAILDLTDRFNNLHIGQSSKFYFFLKNSFVFK